MPRGDGHKDGPGNDCADPFGFVWIVPFHVAGAVYSMCINRSRGMRDVFHLACLFETGRPEVRKSVKQVAIMAVLTLAASIGISPASAFAAPGDSGPWEIADENVFYQHCVEVAGATTANSAQVQIWDCPSYNGSITPLHQRWIFRPTSNGYYRLVNGLSGKCMNIKGSTDVNSTKIIQYPCGNNITLNDQWYPDLYEPYSGTWGHDWYQMRSRLNYAKCLNVQGGNSNRGDDLILYPCSVTANAVFSWRPAKQA